MTDCGCHFDETGAGARRTLIIVLVINAVMFVVEFVAGWIAGSSGLTADSLDMLADAGVYSVSLLALQRSARFKGRAAMATGAVQLLLGLGVLADVLRRFFTGGEPMSGVMLLVGALALAANVACLVLLTRHKDDDVNLRASYIFSTSDVLANMGVIASGALVWLTASRWPDLGIGLVIGLLVTHAGVRIIREARGALVDAAPSRP